MTTSSISLLVLLFLAGLVLVLFELLSPTLVCATLALAAFAGAVVVAFLASTSLGVAVVIAVLVGVPLYFALLVHLLPRTGIGRRILLDKIPSLKASATPEARDYRDLVGKTAIAETMLRPSGAIRVDGRRVIAQAESGIIEAGQQVKIVSVDMANVVVRLSQPQ